MGSKPEKPIKWNVNYENIIDYSFTKFQSDRNDIELIAGCDLFISSGGGLESIAIASRRKIIAINQIPLALAYGLPVRLFIPKLLLDKKTNKFLTMKEIYERKLIGL